MNSHQGLMLALMQPPPGLEEEFSDWYETEHLPQRRGLPGFLNATRWVCIEGFPLSMTAYDLLSLSVLDDPAYRAVSGANSTPWSRRLLARVERSGGRMRVEAEQIWPGHATLLPARQVSRLLVARYPGFPPGHESALINAVGQIASVLTGLEQHRIFVTGKDQIEFWLLAEFTMPVTLSTLTSALGQILDRGADIFNILVPYDKNGST